MSGYGAYAPNPTYNSRRSGYDCRDAGGRATHGAVAEARKRRNPTPFQGPTQSNGMCLLDFPAQSHW